jgi:hypothetical protein
VTYKELEGDVMGRLGVLTFATTDKASISPNRAPTQFRAPEENGMY